MAQDCYELSWTFRTRYLALLVDVTPANIPAKIRTNLERMTLTTVVVVSSSFFLDEKKPISSLRPAMLIEEA